jgi:uncharacterized membrane protein YgcG
MYEIDVIGNEIIIKGGKTVKLPIKNLRLNDGKQLGNDGNKDTFIIDQQKVNYLDSVKDGTNANILKDLSIYPEAENEGYPTFPSDLKQIEKRMLESVKSYLNHTTWTKVKKGSLLSNPKEYNHCLWESGLGYETFLKNPNDVITIKTFGSFIDPLEKQNAKEVWPSNNSELVLTSSFLKLMGFGENSRIQAKTKGSTNFEYELKIGCGSSCNTGLGCIVTHNETHNYFKGNKFKNALTKGTGSINTQDKIKFIVIKEWGDKIQVLIYLMYYHLKSQDITVIMITCDMVVFMLCINLEIPCIYTGAYETPSNAKLLDDKKTSFYSILEFSPSKTPYADIVKRYNKINKDILKENEDFINLMKKLVNKPNTPIEIQGNKRVFKDVFYIAILKDLEDIQNEFKKSYSSINPPKKNTPDKKDEIPEIQKKIDDMKQNYTIEPMIRCKSKNGNLTIIMSKSYTSLKTKTDKPNIRKLLIKLGFDTKNINKIEKQSFYEIANKHFTFSSTTGGTSSNSRKRSRSRSESKSRNGNGSGSGSGSRKSRRSSRSSGNMDDSITILTDEEIDEFPQFYNEPILYSQDSYTQPDSSGFGDLLINENIDINAMFNATFSESFNKIYKSVIKYHKTNTFAYYASNDEDVFYDTLYSAVLYYSYLINGMTYNITPEFLKNILVKVLLFADDNIKIIKPAKLNVHKTIKNNKEEFFEKKIKAKRDLNFIRDYFNKKNVSRKNKTRLQEHERKQKRQGENPNLDWFYGKKTGV